jgi:hypothetical protein
VLTNFKLKVMKDRKELVAEATANGIKGANTIKSVVLVEMLEALNVVDKKSEKRGRPVNEGSVRQIRLKEMEEKRALGLLKRGRPVNTNSVRQQMLAEMEIKRANGELKRGRPAKVKVEEVTETTEAIKTEDTAS